MTAGRECANPSCPNVIPWSARDNKRYCCRECQVTSLNRSSPTCVRLEDATLERLREAAHERGLSMNKLVNFAVDEFLDRLIPVGEWKLTRD